MDQNLQQARWRKKKSIVGYREEQNKLLSVIKTHYKEQYKKIEENTILTNNEVTAILVQYGYRQKTLERHPDIIQKVKHHLRKQKLITTMGGNPVSNYPVANTSQSYVSPEPPQNHVATPGFEDKPLPPAPTPPSSQTSTITKITTMGGNPISNYPVANTSQSYVSPEPPQNHIATPGFEDKPLPPAPTPPSSQASTITKITTMGGNPISNYPVANTSQSYVSPEPPQNHVATPGFEDEPLPPAPTPPSSQTSTITKLYYKIERGNIQDLKNELRAAFVLAKNRFPIFQRAITNKNAVIFLGNPRSGKSTLINYIIASQLISFKIRQNVYYIEKRNGDEPGPHIGLGFVADTTIPGIYNMINHHNTVAIEVPSFSDNRGEVQDIMNEVFVNQLKLARTCKFVLVSDINEIINDNIGGFLSLIDKANKLMPDFEKCQSSVLVITKDNNEYTSNEIAKLLQEKILNVHGYLNIISQQIINRFVQHNELIGLFRMPSEEGVVVNNLDVNIEDAISSTRPLSMKEVSVKFDISSEARVIFLELFQEFSDKLQFEAELDKLIDPYKNYFKVNQYIHPFTDEELLETKQALNRLQQQLLFVKNHKLSNIPTINTLLSSVNDLVPLDENGDFYKTFTLLAMLNNVGWMNQSFIYKLVKKYEVALQVFIANIEGYIKKIEQEEKLRKRSSCLLC